MKPRAGLRPRAFTLIEVLVSMAVLTVLMVLVVRLMGGATSVVASGNHRLDADSQARLIFDRMDLDFAGMLSRPGIDCIFYKNPVAAGGANDSMFFYSRAPGYSSLTTNQSPVTLVGYRVHANADPNDPGGTRTIPQLERIGEVLSWDLTNANDSSQNTANSKPGGVAFLSFNAASAVPDPNSTLAKSWSSTVGTYTGGYSNGGNANFNVIADAAYRFELAFLLKDGTTSLSPILTVTPATWPTGMAVFFHPDTTDPTTASDSNTAHGTVYCAGSRWLNKSTGVGYLCVDATSGAARWMPIGTQDVSAVIVGLALLDMTSEKIVTDRSKLAAALPDPSDADVSVTPPILMSRTWANAVNNRDNNNSPRDFAALSGLPGAAAKQVRTYQRYFYLRK